MRVATTMAADEGGPLATDSATYDAHADWYDRYLHGPAARHTERTTDALTSALGRGSGLCLDLGCGTGVHAESVRKLGWHVVGIDISQGQLMHAKRRLSVAAADVSRLPLRSSCVDAVVATLIHTDIEAWPETLHETGRVLRPGGRFIYVGVHPCFVGPFAERSGHSVRIHPGYTDVALTFDGPGVGSGIRAQVGVRHRSLADLVNAVPEAGLTLTRLDERADGPVPDLLIVEAVAR